MKKFFITMFSFMFVLMFSTSCYAAVTIEPIPDGLEFSRDDHEYYHVFMYVNNSNQTKLNYYFSDNPFTIDAYISSDQSGYSPITFALTEGEDVKVNYYSVSSTTGTWYEEIRKDFTMGGTSTLQVAKVYDSTFNIRQSADSDEVFFQPPLAQELYQMIQAVTAEAMKMFQGTTAGTMKILMVCGVGLIALLVALNLFGKVSRTFHLK